ncbi:MAG: hypothetical protein LBV74_14595 [Tannerella sp.]|jgi:RHS repeat-associated protein|nr:hypothetical protein [Tannerella sp.]
MNMFINISDHLGSVISITDANGTPVFKASYDAWGKQTITLHTIGFHRGYTGHEHLPEFGLINMNGRMYDPIVGRFLSPDPFVQAPDFSQSFNRYSYALNNPLLYTDPTGEIAGLAAAAGIYTLFFTDFGYDVQKLVSPVAVKFEVHPFSSDERFFGVKTSVGLPQILPAAYRWEWGASYYTKFYDTGWQGWQTTYGEEFSLLGGLYSASYTDYKMHGMEDFNQTVLRLRFGVPGLSASYYNDYIHQDKFKFFRKMTPDRIITRGDDKQDRWRTAAAHFQLGPIAVGMKVITGDPGPDGYRNIQEYENGQKYYDRNGEYDPGKYSEGILYVGIGPVRIGRNSEKIRNYFQNERAHIPNNIPIFPMIPGKKPRWYWFW